MPAPRSRVLLLLLAPLAGCGTASKAPERPAPRALPAAAVLAPVRVGGSPSAVAIGGGSVWVADRARGRVLRIDPRTRRRSGPPIEVGGAPQALAVGEGALWVAGGDGTVSSVDLRTGATRAARARVAGANGLAAGAGGVWVTSRIAGTVTRIDPATGLAGRPVRTGRGAGDVVVAAGAVWVANGADGSVSRVDPATSAVAAPIAAGAATVLALAADDRGLWIARAGGPEGDRGSIVRLDPASRRLSGRPVAAPGAAGLDLAAGGGSVWVTDVGSVLPLGRPRAPALVRIDARGAPRRAGAPLRVGSSPSSVAVGAGGVWVADAADGTVTPVRVGG